MFNNVYTGRRVLVTGHTGFKGSWLAFWLHKIGANVLGYALEPPTTPSHFELLKIPVESVIADIRDIEQLNHTFKQFQPEIVFHLAAQPLVRLSYQIPVETFEVNVLGTIKVLEACRQNPTVRATVIVTSDKCYENHEQDEPYRESDPVGGYDPYSASKGCAELVVTSYRNSFFNPNVYGIEHHTLMASARAGNVIGGGDWATDRLTPDLMRAAASGKIEEIRSPQAVRPWQHVLEPLSGYLQLGQKLFEGDVATASAWNFGPEIDGHITVEEAASAFARTWPAIKFTTAVPPPTLHEAKILRLDCSKAVQYLHWHGLWNYQTTFKKTAAWYRRYYNENQVDTAQNLDDYLKDAVARKMEWIK